MRSLKDSAVFTCKVALTGQPLIIHEVDPRVDVPLHCVVENTGGQTITIDRLGQLQGSASDGWHFVTPNAAIKTPSGTPIGLPIALKPDDSAVFIAYVSVPIEPKCYAVLQRALSGTSGMLTVGGRHILHSECMDLRLTSPDDDDRTGARRHPAAIGFTTTRKVKRRVEYSVSECGSVSPEWCKKLQAVDEL